MTAAESAAPTGASARDLIEFFGGYFLLLTVLSALGRLTAQRVVRGNIGSSITRFNWIVYIGRILVPGWFTVGLFYLHWANVVARMLGPVAHWPVELPGVLIGTLPAVLAWIGVIWSQYPMDRALRDQSVLVQLENGTEISMSPGAWSYVMASVRLEVLFTAVPVGMIILLHDIGSCVLWKTGLLKPDSEPAKWIDPALSLGTAAIVFLLAPLILKRVLHTRPLGDSDLRRRLEAMCQRVGLKYREILLWHTDNHMGNAAVMGVVPFVRYILLSDLLLKTMTDEQIEAVFAHELGHVVHRHLTWSGVFVAVLLLAMTGPGTWVADHLGSHMPQWASDVLPTVEMVAGMLLLFGVLMRFFERQADVYAARTVEWNRAPEVGHSPADHVVGEHGAKLFGSALHRVAVINNIPISSRNLTHGSIADRIEYLRELSMDPRRTGRFDRFMMGVYVVLIGVLVICGAWSTAVLLHS